MLGLIALVISVIYLAVLIAVTRFAYSAAKKLGYSIAKCRLAAAGGFLTVWLPVFWDFIPTHVANQYYCATHAGFTVHKTIDKWKAMNPGAIAKLTWNEAPKFIDLPDGVSRIILNERFISETYRSNPIPILSTKIFEEIIIDTENKEVLARHISVGSGYRYPVVGGGNWRGLKFWLQGGCLPMYADFENFRTDIHRLGEKK